MNSEWLQCVSANVCQMVRKLTCMCMNLLECVQVRKKGGGSGGSASLSIGKVDLTRIGGEEGAAAKSGKEEEGRHGWCGCEQGGDQVRGCVVYTHLLRTCKPANLAPCKQRRAAIPHLHRITGVYSEACSALAHMPDHTVSACMSVQHVSKHQRKDCLSLPTHTNTHTHTFECQTHVCITAQLSHTSLHIHPAHPRPRAHKVLLHVHTCIPTHARPRIACPPSCTPTHAYPHLHGQTCILTSPTFLCFHRRGRRGCRKQPSWISCKACT